MMQSLRKLLSLPYHRQCVKSISVSLVEPKITTLKKPLSLAAPFGTSIIAQDSSKVYELRTYSLKPEHMKEYLTLTAEKFHLRTTHSVLHGYWTVELGGVNQVIHLWEYDSYDHRAGVRAKLAVDENWISQYFGKILPWFQRQENMTLNMLPNFDSVVYPKDKGFYELWLIKTKPEACNDFATQLSKTLQDVKEILQGTELCGAFQSEFGNANTTAIIWQHRSFDLTKNLRKAWNEKGSGIVKEILDMETKALIPFKISPLQ